MAGVREVAKLTGVSIATVSNVLNRKQNVGEETRQRVLKAAEELGYHLPSEKDSGKWKNRTIVVHFSDFDTLFYLNILHGISDLAYAREYQILVCSEGNFTRYADPELTCGCIEVDHRCEDQTLLTLAGHGYPIISLDRELDHRNIKCITVNNYHAEKQLVEGLDRSRLPQLRVPGRAGHDGQPGTVQGFQGRPAGKRAEIPSW